MFTGTGSLLGRINKLEEENLSLKKHGGLVIEGFIGQQNLPSSEN